MVEKNFTDYLRFKIQNQNMSFNQVDAGIDASFDSELLQKHLPPTLGVLDCDTTLLRTLGTVIPESTRIALESTEFIGVFGRVLHDKSRKITCLQYLYVYDYQAVPQHEADFEPVFVFLDKNRRTAIYDLIHYCTRSLELAPPGVTGPGLNMVPGWHSFLPGQLIEMNSLDRSLQVQPLSDQHLESWWGIPNDEAKLKIDDFMRNPFEIKSPGHFLRDPDENAQTMCCAFLEFEKALGEFDNPKDALIEGIKRAFTRCVGILALYRLGAFIQLLSEMDQVGLIQLSTSLEKIGLGNLPALLRDGFVTVTNFGKTLFQGYQDAESDE